jgi:hypothetical protein
VKKFLNLILFALRAPMLLFLGAHSLSNAFRDGAMAKLAGTAAGRYKAAFYAPSGTAGSTGALPTVATATAPLGTANGEIAATTNYPAGGVALTATFPTATTMTFPDKVITTAVGETIGPVSVILVYDTADSNKVVALLDYTGATKTAGNGGDFTIDFPTALITVSVS